MINIEKLSLEEKVGQMLCLAFHGTSYNEQLKELIEKHHIGSVIHFAHNIQNVHQVYELNKKIIASSSIPVFIGLDQEGGMVRRVIEDITYMPGAMALSAGANTIKDVYELNKSMASDLRKLGFNINFAPVADVNNNPLNPVISSRSYSDNPEVVKEFCTAAALGMQEGKVLPTLKHFLGHGDTAVDSHLGLPVVEKTKEELKKMELIPFEYGIKNNVEGIMVSHILYSKLDNLPASLSYNVITKLLKEELAFSGLVITDSLTMKAIWDKYSIKEIVIKSILAGNDIIMFCGKADIEEQREIISSFIDAVKSGIIPIERVNSSVQKILRIKEKYQIDLRDELDLKSFNKKSSLKEKILKNSITKVKDDASLLPLKKDDKVLIIFPEIHLASLVDNANNKYESLSKYLEYDEIIINNSLKNLENIVQNINKYDKIILATYNTKEDDFQTKVFEKLDKEKTIVIALRSPYDCLYLNSCKTYICTYDCTKESIMALASCLMTNDFCGKLPIILNFKEKKEK